MPPRSTSVAPTSLKRRSGAARQEHSSIAGTFRRIACMEWPTALIKLGITVEAVWADKVATILQACNDCCATPTEAVRTCAGRCG